MSKRIVCAFLFACAFAALTPRRADAAVQVSLSYFHETLAPHGRWVSAASYGDVWVPRVAAGWEPYVDGEWVYTDWGWTWVSDEPWADVAFHYGTWSWVDPYGWVWVPGLVWAPAWVTWAYADDCVGWAPVPVSFALSGRGYFGRPIVVARARYVFVPARDFVGVRVARVRFPASRNAAFLARATKVTRFEVSRGIVRNVGPQPARIERAAGRRIERVSPDRLRVRPAAVTAAGAPRSRLAVVASRNERARIAAGRTERARVGGKERASARAVKARPSQGVVKTRPSQRVVKARPSQRVVKPRPQSAVKARPSQQVASERRAVQAAPRPARRASEIAPARRPQQPATRRAAPPVLRRPARPRPQPHPAPRPPNDHGPDRSAAPGVQP